MGGLTPTSLSQTVFPPQEGVPWAWAGLEANPFGCHGSHTQGATELRIQPFSTKGQPRGATPWGENTLARRLAGSDRSPFGVVPLEYSSPDGPPILGVLCREYSL